MITRRPPRRNIDPFVRRCAVLHRHLAVLVLFLFAALGVRAADPLPVAGRVEFVAGDVLFIDDAKRARAPSRGDVLRATETVVTGRTGEVHLDMDDGGYLAVRANTRMRVKEFRAQGDQNDRSVVQLLVGTLRAFTGWIPRLSPKNYRVETMTATIGVRGTDHEPYFIPEGSDVGLPGTYDRVNEGSIFMEHPSGTVEVEERRAGFAPLSEKGKARLLEKIPEFFRGSIHEELLGDRHKQVLERLEERLRNRRGGSRPEGPQGGVEDVPIPQGGGGGGVPGLPIPPIPPILPGVGVPGVPGLPSTGIGASPVPGAPPAPPPAPASASQSVPAVADKPGSTPSPAPPREGRAVPGRPRGIPDGTTPAAKPTDDAGSKDRATRLQEQRLRELRDREIRYEIERERALLRDQGRESEAEERVLKRNRERR
jgi:hypothetical protein